VSGFNMPPGVSPNDIPGNRPEDLEYEAFMEERILNSDCEEFRDLLAKLGEEYGMDAPLFALSRKIMEEVHKDPIAREVWENILVDAWESREVDECQ